MQESLKSALVARGLSDARIEDILDSGYLLRNWRSIGTGQTYTTVSDMMYGNKKLSSSFEIEQFVEYTRGHFRFPELPPFRRYKVKSRRDIDEVLSEEQRKRYISSGSLSFRGQPREHRFQRKIPNPVRADSDGSELSIMAGAYRQRSPIYSFRNPVIESRSFKHLLKDIEPGTDFKEFDSHDFMRVEQHYATQTRGLDLSFNIETAIFFATHTFNWDEDGHAYYLKIPRGEYHGVIYGFVFTQPSVKETEFLIRSFDYFKTHQPERILRQACGLPLFTDEERNIATTDLDFIIELDADFETQNDLIPEFIFPPVWEDRFYAKILELKDRFSAELDTVVEYQWAR